MGEVLAVQPPALKGFKGDRPYLAALILCDSILMSPVDGKATCVGLFDVCRAIVFPPVFPGAMVAVLVGVHEPIDLRFDAVGYDSNQLGEHLTIGTARVEPPPLGSTSNVFIIGGIKFPVNGPGTADIVVYGNGERLGSRPVQVVDVSKREGL